MHLPSRHHAGPALARAGQIDTQNRSPPLSTAAWRADAHQHRLRFCVFATHPGGRIYRHGDALSLGGYCVGCLAAQRPGVAPTLAAVVYWPAGRAAGDSARRADLQLVSVLSGPADFGERRFSGFDQPPERPRQPLQHTLLLWLGGHAAGQPAGLAALGWPGPAHPLALVFGGRGARHIWSSDACARLPVRSSTGADALYLHANRLFYALGLGGFQPHA